MASRFHLNILSADLDSIAGHHSITAQIEETGENGELVHVPVRETFGISHDALEKKFGGDAERWREWVIGEMMDRHKKRTRVQGKVAEWTGKKIEIQP